MMPLDNSEKIADRFRERWNEKLRSKEVTCIMILNDRRQMVFYSELCSGRDKDCPFDLREALRFALNLYENYVVIAHNHTSGIAEPSEQDIKLTRSVRNILQHLNFVLVDHIILTPNDYYSFRDNGFFDDERISA